MLDFEIPQNFTLIPQIVAKIGLWNKRKSPKSLFNNNLGDFFCGAYGTRTRDPMRDRHVF